MHKLLILCLASATLAIQCSDLKDVGAQDVANSRNGSGGGAPLTVTASASGTSTVKKVTAQAFGYNAPYAAADNKVSISFSGPIDVASAQTLGNYSIPGLTISTVSAYNSTGSGYVSLTTSTHVPGQTYVLSVNNVQDYAKTEIAAPLSSQSFTGWAFSYGVYSVGETQLYVFFNAQVDCAPLGTAGNYLLDGVAVASTTFSGSCSTTNSVIYLNLSSAPTVGDHILKINNITVSGSGTTLLTPEKSFTIHNTVVSGGGGSNPLGLSTVTAASATTIDVHFYNGTPDPSTGAIVSNYSIPDATVLNATVMSTYVRLTTSTLTPGKVYLLYVDGVQKSGDPSNVISNQRRGFYSYQTLRFSQIKAVASQRIVVTFTDVMGAAAENPAAYSIDGGATITAAAVDSTGTYCSTASQCVVLTTSGLIPGSEYNIDLKNVTSAAGVSLFTGFWGLVYFHFNEEYQAGPGKTITFDGKTYSTVHSYHNPYPLWLEIYPSGTYEAVLNGFTNLAGTHTLNNYKVQVVIP